MSNPVVVRFYTVQDEQDRTRLRAGGVPWPTAFSRAFLGPGFYAWASLADAEAYLTVLAERGVSGIEVIRFEIAEADLTSLNTFDLTTLSDDAANEWLYAHSEWAWARPAPRRSHGYDHVIRGTHNGNHEHHFSPAPFARFRHIGGEPGIGPAVQGN